MYLLRQVLWLLALPMLEQGQQTTEQLQVGDNWTRIKSYRRHIGTDLNLVPIFKGVMLKRITGECLCWQGERSLVNR